jgi:hypothetical protein
LSAVVVGGFFNALAAGLQVLADAFGGVAASHTDAETGQDQQSEKGLHCIPPRKKKVQETATAAAAFRKGVKQKCCQSRDK